MAILCSVLGWHKQTYGNNKTTNEVKLRNKPLLTQEYYNTTDKTTENTILTLNNYKLQETNNKIQINISNLNNKPTKEIPTIIFTTRTHTQITQVSNLF